MTFARVVFENSGQKGKDQTSGEKLGKKFKLFHCDGLNKLVR